MSASIAYESSVENQRKFIEDCETKGSYDGENGQAIRLADLEELRRRVDILAIRIKRLSKKQS
jgi:hypothetical protein